ncbi:lysylphosphatidylglycerol synthase transmembrane domain-containing protein, partial [Patescibacteria group bacterium]
AFLIYKIGWDKIKDVFTMFTWWQFAVLVFSLFLALIFVAISTMIILRALGHKTKFRDMFPLAFVNFTIGYLTPIPYAGGEPVQIYLMHKRMHIPVSAGTTAMILERVARQIVVLIVILVGVTLAVFTIPMNGILKALLVALMIFFIFVLWAYFSKSLSGQGFLRYMIKIFRLQNLKIVKKPKHARVIENIDTHTTNFLAGHPKSFWVMLALASIWTFVMVSQIILVLYFMGYTPTVSNVLLLYMFTNLIVLIPTPAMLGTYEAGGMMVFAIEGLDAGFGLVFSLIMRIANVFAIIPGLLILPYYGLSIREAMGSQEKFRKDIEEVVPLNHKKIGQNPIKSIMKKD